MNLNFIIAEFKTKKTLDEKLEFLRKMRGLNTILHFKINFNKLIEDWKNANPDIQQR